MIRYFAYGSNLDADQMRERCPGSAPLFRARLENYRLDFTHLSRRWRGGAADVLPQAGECVWGFVYHLDADDVPLLDRFEGGYERVALEVIDDDGVGHSVLSYTASTKQSLKPTQVYRDKLIRWGAHWQFPEEYLARLRRLPTL